MKKIFTLAAAVMASLSMMAGEFVPAATAVYTVCDDATFGAQWKSVKQTANYFEVGDTIVMSPYVLYQSANTGYQEWTGHSNGGSTSKTWDALNCFQGSTGMFTESSKAATVNSSRTYYYNVTNCSAFLVYGKSESSKGDRVIVLSAFEITDGVVGTDTVASATYDTNEAGVASLTGLDMTKTYQLRIGSTGSSNSTLYEVAFVGKASTEPKLNVSAEAVEVAVTADVVAPSAQVVFSGKNLAAGTYNLTVPSVEGMTVSPTSVTVGEDGKLNETITIAYASTADVAEATANLSLTIGELTKSVVITYSAVHSIVYSTSVNIEQLVLDNGKSYDWESAFAAANIEYAHMNALDSLNDEKTARNEPYLGLKVKNAEGYIKVGLPAGTVLNVKFGNVAAEVTVAINGVATTSVTEAGTYTVAAQAEDAVVAFHATTEGTVVFKQIMVGEEIAAVTLPESPATAVDNIDAAVKSVKMIENGQLMIIKNGVKYNAQGAVVE